jgi:hypothetical protein
MPPCDTCGNRSRPLLKILFEGKTYRFDSFECAIHKLAPRCEHCGCRIIGHVLEALEHPFCSLHCAAAVGVSMSA